MKDLEKDEIQAIRESEELNEDQMFDVVGGEDSDCDCNWTWCNCNSNSY